MSKLKKGDAVTVTVRVNGKSTVERGCIASIDHSVAKVKLGTRVVEVFLSQLGRA